MDTPAANGVQKVPLYSINDLKHATDDALAPYLTKLPSPYTFQQSHYLTNVRLAAGYSAVLIAASTFYIDWKLGWDATKNYTAIACLFYFVLNGFLTVWIWKYEAGTVFVGLREGRQKITLQSSVKKHVPIYRLKVLYEAPSGKKWEEKEIEGRFTEWFDEDGYLQHAQLRKWLAKNIEVIGNADPPSKKMIEDRVPANEATEIVVEVPRSSVSETPSSAKGARRGKRKV